LADERAPACDEGGGYYDSGYVQPLDFFGDGPL
jgi:hypothetical protein